MSEYSNKQKFDKFYTKDDVVDICINHINFDDYDFVIEPSAGNGSFFNKINHTNKIGLDISPDEPYILKQNWFEYEISDKYKNVLVLGNPPFGKRNKLSKDFIKHALKFSNVKTIAFILPDVYRKHTLQNIVPKIYRLKDIITLPENSFLIGEDEYHVPCSFFIFDKSEGECNRFDPSLYTKTEDWIFSNKNDYDFFIMGASPTTLKTDVDETNRGYYIKVLPNKSIDAVKSNFKKMKVISYSSVNGGVSWITKPELVKNYLENYNKDFLNELKNRQNAILKFT